MKGLIAAAVILGLAGTALGVIALVDDEKGAFEKKTLNLKDGKRTRINFRTQGVTKGHPLGAVAWTTSANVTGSSQGSHVATCVPVSDDDIVCSGALLLQKGNIQYEAIEDVTKGKTNATPSIIGGTGAYEGATGSVQLNFRAHTYKLHLLIPRQ